jgi:hypothetical protein
VQRFAFAVVVVFVAGCASVPRHPIAEGSPLRNRVAQTARELVGQRQLRLGSETLPADCFSLPRAAYGQNGVELGASTPAGLYRKVRREGHWFASGTPRPADLVFLRDADRSRTLHVGLVGGVESDGTVIVLQRMSRGVEAYRMNPRHPHDRTPPSGKRPWNDTIASGGAADGPAAPAGALFSGYASLLP